MGVVTDGYAGGPPRTARAAHIFQPATHCCYSGQRSCSFGVSRWHANPCSRHGAAEISPGFSIAFLHARIATHIAWQRVDTAAVDTNAGSVESSCRLPCLCVCVRLRHFWSAIRSESSVFLMLLEKVPHTLEGLRARFNSYRLRRRYPKVHSAAIVFDDMWGCPDRLKDNNRSFRAKLEKRRPPARFLQQFSSKVQGQEHCD